MRIQRLINLSIFQNDNKKELMQELREYYNRNKITAITKRNQKMHAVETICARCFIAHTIKTAKKLNFDSSILQEIERKQKNVGHAGFYSDNGEIVSCETLSEFVSQ